MHVARALTFVPGDSVFHRLDARTKIAWLLGVSAAVFAMGIGGATALCVATALLLSAADGGWRRVGAAARGIAPFILIALVSNAVLQPGEVVARVGAIAATREGLALGWLICARLLTLVFASSFLSVTTSPLDIASSLEGALGVVRLVGVSPAEAATVVSLTLRALPMLIDEASELRKSVEARGVRLRGGARERLFGLYLLFAPLIFLSLRRSEELALAMEARGYHAGRKRIRLRETRPGWRDVAFGAVSAVTVALLAWWGM